MRYGSCNFIQYKNSFGVASKYSWYMINLHAARKSNTCTDIPVCIVVSGLVMSRALLDGTQQTQHFYNIYTMLDQC